MGKNSGSGRCWGLSVAAAMVCGVLGLCSCNNGSESLPPAVTSFQAERYMGLWHEAARSPNPFEKGMTQVTAVYSLLPDGRILVRNQGLYRGKVKSIKGFARFRRKEQKDRGDLLVSFFRPFYGAYRIVLLGKEYQYSVVLSAGGKYLWILSRNGKLTMEEWEEISSFLREHDISTEHLIWNTGNNGPKKSHD